jgi:Restriction endonuclease
MAKPSNRDINYRDKAQKLTWKSLLPLWRRIKEGATPGWDEGKAFEHLIVRAFELSSLRVEYPFDVPPGGRPIEQIDGMVFLDQIPFLLECKDRDSVDVEAIAKLRNQLLRRPPTTMGCVFTTGGYAPAALILADFAVPHQITLWSGDDIEEALAARDFKKMLIKKYEDLCMFELTDYSPYFRS